MPELPDVELYLAALRPRILGETLERVRLGTPFLLRSVDPPLDSVCGRTIVALRRLGKRIVWQLDDVSSGNELFLVFHLMIAGRFRWRDRGTVIPKRLGLAAFDFPKGTLLMTEASTQKRASLHVVLGEGELARHDPGGIDVMAAGEEEFATALRKESHTLKRALTDPHLFSGIGNAYSDEILHRAKLSPFKLTRQLRDADVHVLHAATRETLLHWITRLQEEAEGAFPEKVTAFHEGMAVHGRFGKPCPRCATPVQRLVHGEHEVNYCPTCQTEGRLLADRALSKLLKDDWPKTLDQLERCRGKSWRYTWKMDVPKTEDEWRAALTPEQFQVLRNHGTERAGTSPLNREHRPGVFTCAGCGQELFKSDSKFESGTGWPSFYTPLENAIETTTDRKLGMVRTEVHCATCKGHLGHVFEDGPPPTGLRYCMNGVSLAFDPAKPADRK